MSLFDGLSSAIIAAMPHMTATYRLFKSNTFDPAAGTQVSTFHDVVLNMVQEPTDVREVSPNGAGPVQLGDVVYLFPYHEIANALSKAKSGNMSTSDHVVLGTVTFRVVNVQTLGSNTIVRVTVRRLT